MMILCTIQSQRLLGALSAALTVGAAVAFVPGQAPKPQVDFGKAVQRILLAPAVILGIQAPMVVPPAHADGAVSAATVTRAGVTYGPVRKWNQKSTCRLPLQVD